MNFFEDQRLAKKKTSQLIKIFIFLVIGISISSALIIMASFFYGFNQNSQDVHSWQTFFSWFLTVESIQYASSIAGTFCSVIIIITFFKTKSLKEHPEKICEDLGATKVAANTKDFRLMQYRNIVQEMSIASSVPMPTIYVLKDDAINAFACGYDINSAAICVTSGALKKLNRDELQAVVAHEYSHILNGDMSINLKLIGMLSGLLFIYYGGSFLLRSQGRSRNKGNASLVFVGIGLIVLGLLGFFFGRLLMAAISRQREYLADASSVQFTRNPDGIVGALKKIAISSNNGIIQSAKADQAAHMFLVEGVKKKFFSFATHPDIYDRIKAVDAKFDKFQFKAFDYEELEKEMKKLSQEPQDQSFAKKSSAKKTQNPTAIKNIECLLPLFSLYAHSQNQLELTQNPEKELLLRFVANQDTEIKNLSPVQKLEILEVIFGEIKSLNSKKRKQLHESVLAEIKKDGIMDFDEFIIYAYLRPALTDIKIMEKKLSSEQLQTYGNMLLNFMWHMDKIDMTQINQKDISNIISFKKLNTKSIDHVSMVKVLEKIRFCPFDQKNIMITACTNLVHINKHVTEKEKVMLSLIKQILAVPGLS